MDKNLSTVREELMTKQREIKDETERNKGIIIDSTGGSADSNDRATVQEAVRSARVALDRLNKKNEVVGYLLGLLENGWELTCTGENCETPLTVDRVVGCCTSLCVECKSALELAEKRKGNHYVFH